MTRARAFGWTLFAMSAGVLLFELLLTRIFAIVMFAQFAHLAISSALLGLSIGALAVHLFPRMAPPDRLELRLGIVALVGAVAMIGAAYAAVRLPFNKFAGDAFGPMAGAYRSRAARMVTLMRADTLALAIPAVALPFACLGATGASVFRHLRESVGALYAADLAGGALGCLVFIPILRVLSAPDAVSVAALLCASAATFLLARARSRVGIALGAVVILGAGTLGGFGLRREVLRPRWAAGFDERAVKLVRWTPLARISVLEPPGPRWNTFIALDNTSRSRVVIDANKMVESLRSFPWSGVFHLGQRPGRVMVLAAGAGSEVNLARSFGHRDVSAVELAGEYFDIVRTRYKNVPGNPYMQPGVHMIVADARSAVLHSRERFAIIETMQANYFTFGGMLAEAWDPGLLFTEEAIETYFQHLAPGGAISAGGGPRIWTYTRSAWAALLARGVTHPGKHIAVFKAQGRGDNFTFIAKPEPFTKDEIARLRAWAASQHHRLLMDPGWPTQRRRVAAHSLLGYASITDDHPYPETFRSVWKAVNADSASLTRSLYRMLLLQVAVLFGFGIVIAGVPLLVRGRRELARVPGAWRALGYCGAIGYGFLGVEIVLIHQLVLFVGHPTYAVTVVLLSLLLGSGAGSLAVARLPERRIERTRRVALPAIVVLAAIHALVLSPALSHYVLGLPLGVRAAIAAASLIPLGFLLGFPFPLAMRILPAEAGPLVPWCWAVNGWTSVLTAVTSIFLARLAGYRVALAVALAAYALAVAFSYGLSRVGIRTVEPALVPPEAPVEPPAAAIPS